MNQPTPPAALIIPYRTLKVLAILVGGPLTLVALMSLAGFVVSNGWIRLGVALLVGVGLPLLLADRLLPEDDPTKGKGLPSDVFAVGWLGFALLYVGVLAPFTAPLLSEEGARLKTSGLGAVGASVQWIAGPQLEEPDVSSDENQATGTDPQGDGGSGDGGGGDGGGASTDASVDAPTEVDAGITEPPPPSSRLTPAEIFRRWAPSVVSVQTGRGGGTGFLIGSDGTVVTNHHVIENARSIRVKFMDGTWATEVWLLADDEEQDLALLQVITPTTPRPTHMSDSDDVTVGEQTVAIGNPLGLEHTLTEGIISARRMFRGRRFIQTSTPISPGNSGGPLFNSIGEVVGVTTMGSFGMAQNLNLAVPINDVKELIQPSYPEKKKVGGGEGSGMGSW